MPRFPLWPTPLSGLLPLVILLVSPPARATDRPLLTPGDALSQPAPTAAPEAEGAEAPATERGASSIWAEIEGDDAGAPAAAALSKELAEERLAELGYTGALGAEPPVEFYMDPLGATNVDPLQLERVDPKEFDIPVVTNTLVKKWMTYFLGNGRKYYGRYLMRSTRWMPMMHAALEARGMPRDLVYLSMIESGFTTSATSYAAAAGLWQFMPATGRQYGLRVDWWMDDRRDPEKATRAALDYLSYLHKLFEGDWWLAWASYNGGEGRVMKETRRHGTTDFWTLVERGALHSETQNYVPKLIAAAIIGKHPERYGFVGVKYQDAFAYDAVTVPGATGLDVIAKCAAVKEEDILELNPALRRWALPPDGDDWTVRLPSGTKAAFEVAFALVPPEERITLVRHVVKKKESLASIAKKYGVEAEDVARLNHLTTKSRIKVGQELVVPARPGVATMASVAPVDVAAPESTSAPAKETVTKTHTVKSGDTLSGIASKYGVSVEQLQKLNGIKGTKILSGQKLKVSVSEAPAEPAPKASSKTSSKSSVKATTTKSVSYTVKGGDTLGSIAERYDCSVTELKSWNGLKGSTIYPGQKLKIKQ
ncbi:hypothetical protein LBMAG42_56150 [Deltaproteobacteria bacterium]|nr:hypothetical protein LBMAG42_56150 [Deltaproteobacteria bacterium]